MKPEETVDYNLKVAWHAISHLYASKGAPHELTASSGFLLLRINPDLGTTPTELMALLGLQPRSITRLLQHMQENGLIYRRVNSDDKRSVRIFLTPQGLEKKEIARQTVRHFNQKIQTAIPPRQLNAFLQVVEQITEMAEDKDLFQDFEPLPLRQAPPA